MLYFNPHYGCQKSLEIPSNFIKKKSIPLKILLK
nr:MAG TPA: hypothetical protein [Caudoviricetes sp.]